MTLVGNEAVKPVRPIPKVKLDDSDEQLIQLAMVGAFLSTYNMARGLIDAAKEAGDLVESLEGAQDAVSRYMDFQSTLAFPKAALGLKLLKKVRK